MKIAAVLFVEAIVALAAFSFDGAAQWIVLYAAAAAGVVWFAAKFGVVIRLMVRLLQRTIAAVEAFEELPKWREEVAEWRQETDGRLSAVEAEVALTHNGMKAIIRELGIEDAVRRIPPDVW